MGSDEKALARNAAARGAMEMVSEGDLVGLGSGRAVWAVIDALRDRWPGGAPPLRAVAASSATEERAREAGIEVVELDGSLRPALAIDGADEIDASLGLLKGGGGALLREKIVISASERFVCVAETGKQVERLGDTRGLPVEVVRFGWRDTRRRLLEAGLVAGADLRVEEDGEAFPTDSGNVILDCAVPPAGSLASLDSALCAVPGVVEHGLFLGMTDTVLLGTPEGELETLGAG